MDAEFLKWAMAQGAGWAAAGVLAVFYRRDFLRKLRGQQEAHERRDQREERLLQIIERDAGTAEKLASAIQALEATLSEQHRATMVWIDRFNAQLGEMGHDLKTVLDRFPRATARP